MSSLSVGCSILERIFIRCRYTHLEIVNFCNSFYVIYTNSFVQTLLSICLTQDPILSGLPYVVIFFTAFFSGIWADKLINRAFVPATIVRKIMQGVGESSVIYTKQWIKESVVHFISETKVGCPHFDNTLK